ncbi:MAG TPA: class I SAM-dependent methyltransferase, partial [Silvibacterium sp.]|nr:class I SAM-dependent methyltransferase [Silvibacterium sp.]
SFPLPEPILTSLPEPFRSVLLSMCAGDSQLGTDGEKHSIDPAIGICPAEGIWIYELCRQIKPQATLEIGLAYGFSTLYFLAALVANGSGRHTSIDPYQMNAPGPWAGIGLAHGRRLGRDRFQFIEERSFAALTHLADSSGYFDIIFVDGRHFFDVVVTEFTLSVELCSMGGYIILHDLWLPAIQRAVAFIRTNRADFKYVETSLANIAVFQHTGTDERQFKHFVDFCNPDRSS